MVLWIYNFVKSFSLLKILKFQVFNLFLQVFLGVFSSFELLFQFLDILWLNKLIILLL